MNQEWLIKNVLKHLDSIPDRPDDDRDYLSLEDAQRIVDETIDYLGVQDDDSQYTYINGHRKRLAHSLSMIPKAKGKGESCLDVGSYGYMCLWAIKYLGYEHVEGIEWHPDHDDPIIHRTIKLEDDSVEIKSHNFDLSGHDWTIKDSYDTVLFFEVLEHINHDPMGVMSRIHDRLKPGGTLVMSVPNAISYKAFKEFLVGMPPWTYWFYQPDLSHEPRHCFEYTPIVFKALIQAAGLRENAFRTIYAYTEQENEQETLEIARSFGIEDRSFGETMIINATKVAEAISIRYPDVLYSPDGYYKNVYPHLHDRLAKAVNHFRNANLPAPVDADPDKDPEHVVPDGAETIVPDAIDNTELADENVLLKDQLADLLFTCDAGLLKQEQLQSRIEELEADQIENLDEIAKTRDWAENLKKQRYELEARINELLFTCDCYLRKEGESESVLTEAQESKAASMIEIHDTRVWAESLSKENTDLRGQVNELLFSCDCYLQQINDPDRCVQVIRQKRFRGALRTTKSVARKTPILRTVLRPVYRGTKKFIKNRI